MKSTRKWLHVLALVALTAVLLPHPSHACSIPGAGAQYETAVAPPSQDSWIGAAAAIGCGFGIRVSRVTGNLWVVGGTVILCLIMLADGALS